MAGTISIIVMLSTPALAQAQVVSDKSLVPLLSQYEIVGLRASVDQQAAEDVIFQAQIKALEIDVTGLTDDEIKIQLKTASHAKQLATLQARAKARDINIAGLTNDQAKIKIKAVDRITTLTSLLAQAKTLGISIDKEQID